jgi:hypothetical protein
LGLRSAPALLAHLKHSAKLMKSSIPLLIIAATLLLAGCASTEFQAFEGKASIFEGLGGTKTVIGGVEFWENGEPPRKFKLLGIISDERPAGLIPMASLKKDIAKKAKEQKADAVILLSSESKLMGTVYNASATTQFYGNTAVTSGSGTSVPVMRNNAKFAIVRYVD